MLCSADIANISAYYNKNTGLGSLARLHCTGEEEMNGRAFCMVVTGKSAGVAYELPNMGRAKFENILSAPYEQDITVVIGLDDAMPGYIYVYIGKKEKDGSEIQKAGLLRGRLYGLVVDGYIQENYLSPPRSRFHLVLLGDDGDVSQMD